MLLWKQLFSILMMSIDMLVIEIDFIYGKGIFLYLYKNVRVVWSLFVENKEFLRELVEAMYEELPTPKKK